MPTISRETQSWRFILCYGNNMSTLPRLRLLTQHCRWRRSTSLGKRMGTCDRSEEPFCNLIAKVKAMGVGHHVKHKQKPTLECHLLNLTIFVVDLIRSELVWHFWLNSVLVFILSLQKNTSRVSLFLSCFVF